ncbi:MAG: hypothetical protein PUJ82_13045 [Spirochaetales bacterium]|nr:hypothetical protein [Spirochaetia bacterium]MDD7460444.1 hypothetical protein [Spirochaetales bacterium]MDD7611831.1 hypothetical protein [Spirochaetales bacterium]MDY5914091.1 ABC-three component system protein [Treponema sp.]
MEAENMEFCFADYVRLFQPCYLEYQNHVKVINDLLWFYVMQANINGKTGDALDIDKPTASYLINRKRNLPRVLRTALKNKDATDELLIKSFNERIMPNLDSNKIENLVNELWKIIEPCEFVSSQNKELLSSFLIEKKYTDFLAISLKFTLNITNKKTDSLKADDEIENKIQNKIPSQKNKIPYEIQENENLYITAIVDAISEKDSHAYSLDELKNDQKYGKKLERHRNEFYSAESVRRVARDIFDENEDPFDELQDELMDGIYYTVNKDYNNGYERLTSSLEQAAQVAIESNPLIKETDVVSMKAKQGLCHTLVNDKKLDGWTNDKYI